MSEWWTYALSDLLLFSPRTYYRLFELYNASVWPAQIAAIAVGIVILYLLVRPGPMAGKLVAGLLAACWLFVACGYFYVRYATINWAAPYFAAGFALEAFLLIWIGIFRGSLLFRLDRTWMSVIGLCIYLFALALLPLIGPLLGRPWMQAEIFGLAPDPTAIATLGLLLIATGRMIGVLLVIPMIWCAVSAATLWTMGSPEARAVIAVLFVCILATFYKTRSDFTAPAH